MTFIHLNSKTEPRVRSNWPSRQFESNFGTQALDSLHLQTNGVSPVVIGALLIAFDAILSFPRNFVFHE